MTSSRFLIALITFAGLFLQGSSGIAASENMLCSDLFKSQIETPNLIFSSVIYSPTVQHNGRVIVAEEQLLNETKDLQTGKVTTSLRLQEQPYYDGYIGFLPSPDYVEKVNLYLRFAWGLETFVQGFSSRSTPAEQNNIREADRRMFHHFMNSHRLGFAALARPGALPNSLYSAWIRVYDATDYSRFGVGSPIKNQFSHSYYSPTEISFDRNGVKTEVFENLRKQGYQIFQIGKYVYDPNLTSDERDAARIEIFKWLLRNYLDPSKMVSDKVMFVINVDSLVHERAYGKLFGTNKVDGKLFDPPIEPPNGILLVDLPTLKAHLEKIIAETSVN